MNISEKRLFPPCRTACPAGINVQAYIALISKGKFKEALEVVRRYIPFPSVCGRVCFSPCEDKCTRSKIDESVSIRALKRFIADYELATTKTTEAKPPPKTYTEKVAIIGSGPAGLTAAYDLAKMGYPVTVFEKFSEPGGMLRTCIPRYRLPRDILDMEIEHIKSLGVTIRTNVEIGKGLTLNELFKQGYKAVFIAVGAQKSRKLGIEGENLKGVYDALEFLKEVNTGKNLQLGERVAVIGGGNVAVDAARTALRLHPKEVLVLYRRSKKEMPAHHQEIEEAEREGVKFQFLVAPKRFLGENGTVKAMECIKTALGPPDETGRRRPIPIEGSEFTIPVDTIIPAVGETPDVSAFSKTIETTQRGTIIVNPETLETSMRGVFAGGDAVTGPASVIEAIAAGKKAAVSIDRYLRGEPLPTERKEEIVETTWLLDEGIIEKKPRQTVPTLSLNERTTSFKEVELGFTAKEAVTEAHRCLLCGPCSECLESEDYCEPGDAIVDEDRCIACANCEKVCAYRAIKVQESVAKVDTALCKGCGTCFVECPAMTISISNLSREQITSMIKQAVSSWKNEAAPRILAFLCTWNWYGANLKRADQLKSSSNVVTVEVSCSGSIDQLHLLQAFTLGADGVFIGACPQGECHFVCGNVNAEKRIRQVQRWLKEIGVQPQRIRLEQLSTSQPEQLEVALQEFAEQLKKLGSTGLMK